MFVHRRPRKQKVKWPPKKAINLIWSHLSHLIPFPFLLRFGNTSSKSSGAFLQGLGLQRTHPHNSRHPAVSVSQHFCPVGTPNSCGMKVRSQLWEVFIEIIQPSTLVWDVAVASPIFLKPTERDVLITFNLAKSQACTHLNFNGYWQPATSLVNWNWIEEPPGEYTSLQFSSLVLSMWNITNVETSHCKNHPWPSSAP